VYVSLRQHIGAGGDAEGDELYDIENLQGSDYGDLLIGDHHVNKLEGFDGNDHLKGWGGNDYLLGGAGDDIIEGGAGGDAIDGGFGIDTASYEGSPEGVWVDLQNGGDHDGHAEEDSLLSIENLTGSNYADTLKGDNGDNVLRGLDGQDTLMGRGGVDILWGGGGDDQMHGGNWGDTLFGEAGNDYLVGGYGIDDLYGGAGADTFVWDDGETGASVLLADDIVDFNAAEGDRIDLSSIDANIVADGNQAFTFIGNAAFSGAPGEARYYHSGGNTYIEMQTGTSADPEGVIRLAGIHTPEASWFYL
jgi:Ca2+-binding RTX toxin-like protein